MSEIKLQLQIELEFQAKVAAHRKGSGLAAISNLFDFRKIRLDDQQATVSENIIGFHADRESTKWYRELQGYPDGEWVKYSACPLSSVDL